MINKSTINKIIVYLLLIAGSFIMIFPFVWMILSSFKTSAEIIAFPPKLFPSQFNFSNYKRAFQMAPFGKYFLNSALTSAGIPTQKRTVEQGSVSFLAVREKSFVFRVL